MPGPGSSSRSRGWRSTGQRARVVGLLHDRGEATDYGASRAQSSPGRTPDCVTRPGPSRPVSGGGDLPLAPRPVAVHRRRTCATCDKGAVDRTIRLGRREDARAGEPHPPPEVLMGVMDTLRGLITTGLRLPFGVVGPSGMGILSGPKRTASACWPVLPEPGSKLLLPDVIRNPVRHVAQQ